MYNGLLLAGAIVAEVIGTTCMKLSDGLTRPWPVAGIVLFYVISFVGLTLALRTIDMSVAYAVWSGLGVAFITVIGIFFFNEPLTAWRSGCILLILVGVVGLNLAGT